VNVNLATGGVIIATHVTAEGESEYCFENLLRGVYTVSFTDSPLYRITTAREGTFALDARQRLTLDPFGAFPVGAEGLRAEVVAQAAAASEDEPLDTPTRLLLATVGATMVMLLMIGLGAVLIMPCLISSLRSSLRAGRSIWLPPILFTLSSKMQ